MLARDFSCPMSGKFVHYQKINRLKIKIAEKWCYSDDIALGLFLCNVVWRILDNTEQGFYLCNVVPRELRQYWTGFFPVQCCLKSLGQHCTRFLPVHCWPMVNRQLFWVKEPVQFCVYQPGTTLHMNIVNSMLFKYFRDNIAQENYRCYVGPDHIVIYSVENNHIQCCLDLPDSTLH